MVAGVGYFPVDWWPFSARAWSRIRPDLVILTEGERWPEHLRQAKKRGVPVIAINARLSDRSFRRLKLLPSVARLLVGGVTRLLPGSTQDAARFLELGVPADTIAKWERGEVKIRHPEVLGRALRDIESEATKGSAPLRVSPSIAPLVTDILFHEAVLPA
jgi:3-deoxy-D-manno-octulosonic-acid transferase